MNTTLRIGLISDTHGVVHPRVPEVFANVDAIVHAGDVGGEHVLRALRALAPVTYVDGNNDDNTGEDIERFTLGGLRILLTHILPRPHRPDRRVVDSLRRDPADLVLFGHSHLPHDEHVAGVHYFNPASAGPRRFNYPTSVGLLEKRGDAWTTKHVPLDERSVEALGKFMNQMSR
jgi:putative phosphoesterase